MTKQTFHLTSQQLVEAVGEYLMVQDPKLYGRHATFDLTVQQDGSVDIDAEIEE